MNNQVEVVPAVLRATLEGIEENWSKVASAASHIQIDVTDGVFAGDGSFREVVQFKKLPHSEKTELHMMVHNPGYYVDQVIDLNPARCVFHIEAFSDGGHVDTVYKKLRAETDAELGLALTSKSPVEWLYEQVALIDYVQFLNVLPGYSGNAGDPHAFRRIGSFKDKYPDIPIAADGGINKENITKHVAAGASMLCAASAIFKEGDPVENLKQLQILAETALLA